jgi:hypothetical protein
MTRKEAIDKAKTILQKRIVGHDDDGECRLEQPSLNASYGLRLITWGSGKTWDKALANLKKNVKESRNEN